MPTPLYLLSHPKPAYTNKMCYCGADKAFSECCEPIILRTKIAQSAEQLMRSRFSAFYTRNSEWLKDSWHPSSRPQKIHFEDGLTWLDLSILNSSDIDELNSTVEFEARYIKNGKILAIHENSHFKKREQRWFYVDGDYLKTTFKAFKLGRNEACPCGSKRKYKNCCALE